MEATMHEAKTQLSKLVKRTLDGEEVILTHGRKRVPVVKLVVVTPQRPAGAIRSLPKFKMENGLLACTRDKSRLDLSSLSRFPMMNWRCGKAEATTQRLQRPCETAPPWPQMCNASGNRRDSSAPTSSA